MEQNTNQNTGQPINRSEIIDTVINQVEEKNDQVLTVLLEDIDGAINYYFTNVMKPRVTENGMFIQVPVMYGSPERWKSVQVDGFVRDNKGRLVTPLIMFKRNSVAQNPDLPVDKLDANNPNIHYAVQKRYSQKNRYDNFNILTGVKPITEFYNIVMPDYITAIYEVILWTSYVSQMNKLVESLVYSSGAYWGDSSKFRFRTIVSDIATPVEITNDTDRTSKSTLTLTVYGYLVPDNISKIIAQKGEVLKKSLSVKKTTVFAETDTFPRGIFGTDIPKTSGNVSVTTPGATVSNSANAAITQMLRYLNKQFSRTATSVTVDDGGGNTAAIFASESLALPPSEFPLTQTIKENFLFFVNGQFIEHSAIVSFSQVGNGLKLVVNSGSLGFAFDSGDEIVGVGKFNS